MRLFESEARRHAAEREARITSLAQILTRDILYGTGTIGQRMRLSTQPQPERGEHPLAQELLERLGNHELFARTLRFTQRVLPIEYFLREDGTTPYIRHVERTTHLVLDLLPQDMPMIEKVVRASVTVAHDSEEEPQERYMENIEENIENGLPKEHNLERKGGKTQTGVRVIFDEEMEGLPDDLHPFAEEIYNGIHAFNRHYADNSTKLDEDYLKGLSNLGGEKLADRTGDSPHGDMSRIARMVEAALAVWGPEDRAEKLAELADALPERYDRLTKSTNKARRMKDFAATAPEAFRDLREATIRAGDGFKAAVDTMLREEYGIVLRPSRKPRSSRLRTLPRFSKLFP